MRLQCIVGLEGGSRGHSTVRQPDSQGSQTVVLEALCFFLISIFQLSGIKVVCVLLLRHYLFCNQIG